MRIQDIFTKREKVAIPPVIQAIETQPVNVPTLESMKQSQYLASLTTYVDQQTDIIKKKKSVLDNLVQMNNNLTKKTIQDWRMSLQAAEDIKNPNRWMLLDLYTELKRDPFLGAVTSYQKNKLKSIDRLVKDENGNVDEATTKLFNSTWFDQFIDNFVEAQLQGFQLLEVSNLVKKEGVYTIDRLDVIPPKNVVPEFQALKKNQFDYNYNYKYDTNEWLIELIINDNRNIGILSRLAPYLLFKVLAVKSWASYIENYSLPYKTYKTDTADKSRVNEILAEMKNMGSNVNMVLPTYDQLDMVTSNSTDAYNTFSNMIDMVDTTVANEICGGSLLFKAGDNGSYSLSNTHMEVSKLKTKSDLSEISRYVNSFLIPKLKRLGLIKANYNCFFSFSDTENLTRQELIAILTPVMQYYKVNEEWLQNALNIKIDGSRDAGISANPTA